ncbi:MAG TPA: vitamin K epoxide reductase family protein [Solirubrobacteraceae bacterium]|nr:vitamin K epoxide reductase family protein [Solirubrobacteraceae bacterium]
MSARALRVTLIVLAAVGIALAGYLTYVHYSGTTPPCSIKGNPCSQVQKSRYSELAGVPVALIGLLGYIVILGSLLASEGERARFATMALTLGGLGFSAYLTYREVFTLHKICEWCVGSAVLMTIMMCLSVWRFLRGDVDAQARAAQALAELDGPQPDTPAAALPG